VKSNNKKTVLSLVGLVVLMFGFGFAMVPLYNLICQYTGLKPIGKAVNRQVAIDTSRQVLVEFDGIVNSNLPWSFVPSTRQVKVNPGKLSTVEYIVTNEAQNEVTGQAIPSVIPWYGNKYFTKAECFCFNKQTLKPGETKRMPVKFYVDPSLPDDIKTLRLSYTFMNINKDYGQQKQAVQMAQHK